LVPPLGGAAASSRLPSSAPHQMGKVLVLLLGRGGVAVRVRRHLSQGDARGSAGRTTRVQNHGGHVALTGLFRGREIHMEMY
jgi:hypothetical protein